MNSSMSFPTYGMASSSESQAGAGHEWLSYESNNQRMNQNQDYSNVNTENSTAAAAPNPPVADADADADLDADADVDPSPTPSPSQHEAAEEDGEGVPAEMSQERTGHEDEQPENEPYSIVNTPAEQPVKRRGRPPKSQTQARAQPSSADGVAVPKRRGRPPKSAKATPVASNSVVPPICIQMSEDAVVVPKRRGRPPKAKPQATTLLADMGEMLDDPDAAPVVTPKRRGRPPGRPSKPKPVVSVPTSNQNTPKRRGRPPKAKPAQNGASNGDSDIYRLESAGADDEHYEFETHENDDVDVDRVNLTVADPPKRKRGRPPKNQSASLGAAPKSTPKRTPKPKRQPGEPPRKRGRPPKSASAANGGSAVTKLQVDSSAFDGTQAGGDASYDINATAAGDDETEVFGFGDGPAMTTAVLAVDSNGTPKRKRGRPPKAKPSAEIAPATDA